MPTYVMPPMPENVAMAVEALGNRVRVSILSHLAGTDSATSREIAEALSLGIRPVQRHLWALQDLGLVVDDQPTREDRRGGPAPRYSVNPEAVTKLYRDLGRYLGLG